MAYIATHGVYGLKQQFYKAFQNDDIELANTRLDQLLCIDPNNAELLKLKLMMLQKLEPVPLTKHIGFLRKLCWYRSSDPECFAALSDAYFAAGEEELCILACCFYLSLEADQAVSDRLSALLDNRNSDRVKIYFLKTDRIGHLTVEPDSWLRNQQLEPDGEGILHLFVGDGTSCNDAFYGLLKRYIYICESDFFHRLHFTRQTLLSDNFYQKMPYDNSDVFRSKENVDDLVERVNHIYRFSAPVIELSDSERKQGLLELASLVPDPSQKIVCFHVRDSAYLSHNYPALDTSYHDYRDSDISNMTESVNYLLELGYLVIRIGSVSNQYLAIEHPYYLDLCAVSDASSLLELYVIESCEFYIGTSSGPASVPAIFNKPMLQINACPFVHPHFNYARIVPKFVIKDGNYLNFISIAEGQTLSEESDMKIQSCHNGSLMEQNALSYQENSEQDILAAVQEFVDIIARYGSSKDATLTVRQQTYRSKLPIDNPAFINESVVCDSFLSNYPELF